MSAALFSDLVRFLSVLEPIQKQLEAVYSNRLLALAGADTEQLNALASRELDLQQELRRHLKIRSGILGKARAQGFRADSLRRLLDELPVGEHSGISPDQHRQTAAWMKRIEERSWKLRRDSWVNWTVVTRSSRQCREMRQIIATAGEQTAAGTHDDRQPAGGGALLDARV